MNWIAFAEQRPKEEPERDILYKNSNGPFRYRLMSSKIKTYPGEFSDWCEIEPPGMQVTNAIPESFREAVKDFQQGKTVDMETAITKPPPKPDPIRRTARCGLCYWALYDGETCFNQDCAEHGKVPPHVIDLTNDEAACLIKEKSTPPKPDPFEEWWKEGESMCDGRVPKIFACTIWDAAIKWKEGEK